MGEREADANRKQVLAFSPFLYKYRNLVERFFSKIKHFRAVATATTRIPTTSWPALSSQPCVSGCELYESTT